MQLRFFKLEKHKQFNYKPRYYQEVEESENGKFSIRKHSSRTTTHSVREQWRELRNGKKKQKKKSFNSVFIIFVLLFLLALYFLKFDLSIFFKR